MSPPLNVNVLAYADPYNYALATCPQCGVRAILDEDQYYGRVSILCDCGYHETYNLSNPPALSENAE